VRRARDEIEDMDLSKRDFFWVSKTSKVKKLVEPERAKRSEKKWFK